MAQRIIRQLGVSGGGETLEEESNRMGGIVGRQSRKDVGHVFNRPMKNEHVDNVLHGGLAAFEKRTSRRHDTPRLAAWKISLGSLLMLRNWCRGAFAFAPWLVLMGMLALAGSGIPSGSAFAQEEEEPAAKEKSTAKPADAGGDAAEAPAESQSMLMWLIETSGLIGAIILVISIFFVHRVVTLFLEFRPEIVAPPDLLEQIEGLLTKRDYNGVYQAAKKSESALGQLLISGMTAMSSGLGEAREAMDRTGEAITVHMEKRISLLAVIGSLGPMIGLLGTLKGMIGAFSGIALSGTQLKASQVAGNISEALVLTFEGVAISIPAIYLFSFFKDRVATLTVDVQNLSDELIRKMHAAAHAKTTPPQA